MFHVGVPWKSVTGSAKPERATHLEENCINIQHWEEGNGEAKENESLSHRVLSGDPLVLFYRWGNWSRERWGDCLRPCWSRGGRANKPRIPSAATWKLWNETGVGVLPLFLDYPEPQFWSLMRWGSIALSPLHWREKLLVLLKVFQKCGLLST